MRAICCAALLATTMLVGAALGASRGRDAGAPWTSRLNVPLPVVRRVTVDSSLDDPLLVTEYDYANGAWEAIAPGDYHNPSQRGLAALGRNQIPLAQRRGGAEIAG